MSLHAVDRLHPIEVARFRNFAEGIVFDASGYAYVSHGRVISRIAPDGKRSVWAETGAPGGHKILPDGSHLVCDASRRAILRLDAQGKILGAIASGGDGKPLVEPNDLTLDPKGGFYFTDLGKRYARNRDHGGLYYALPDGSKIVELVHPMLSPNGVGLSPDEKTVYVADTETSRLFAFDIVEPGVLRKEPFPAPYTGRLVCGLPGFQRFDSLAVEASGNIAVATLITGHITVIAPSGNVVRQVKMPDVYPTNICFGGRDMKTAYITLSGSGQLAAMDWPEPGLRLNFQE